VKSVFLLLFFEIIMLSLKRNESMGRNGSC